MNMNDIDHWDLSAMRAAAARERAEAVSALLARFGAWLRSLNLVRAPRARPRECQGCGA